MQQEHTTPYDMALPPCFSLGEHVIRRAIGQGGFGITDPASNEELHIHVVIKEKRPTMFVGHNPQAE